MSRRDPLSILARGNVEQSLNGSTSSPSHLAQLYVHASRNDESKQQNCRTIVLFAVHRRDRSSQLTTVYVDSPIHVAALLFIGLYFQCNNLTWNKEKLVREAGSSYEFRHTPPYLTHGFTVVIKIE